VNIYVNVTELVGAQRLRTRYTKRGHRLWFVGTSLEIEVWKAENINGYIFLDSGGQKETVLQTVEINNIDDTLDQRFNTQHGFWYDDPTLYLSKNFQKEIHSLRL
jgi:hypothetical protein